MGQEQLQQQSGKETTPGAFFTEEAKIETAPEPFAKATLTMPSADEAAAANAKAAARATFEKFVPEAYKAREWVKNAANSENPIEEVFKQYEHAQSLIGSRNGVVVPGPDATPEQVKEFHKQLGVPDDITAYVIKPVTWEPELKEIGEFIGNDKNPKVIESVAKTAQRIGVTPAQLQELAQAQDRALAVEHKEALSKQIEYTKTVNADFSKIVTEKFGARSEQVLQGGKQLIEQNAPDWAREILKDPKEVSNKGLAAIAAMTENIRAKYIREGSYNTQNTQSQTAPMTEDAIRAEMRNVYAHKDWRNAQGAQHKELVAKDKQLTEQLRLARGGSRKA